MDTLYASVLISKNKKRARARVCTYVCARDRVLLRCGSLSSVKVSRDRCQTKEKKNEIPRGSNKTLSAYYVLRVAIIVVLIPVCTRISPSATYFGTSKTRLCGTRPRSRNDRLRRLYISNLNMFLKKKTKTKHTPTFESRKYVYPDYIVPFVYVPTIIRFLRFRLRNFARFAGTSVETRQ